MKTKLITAALLCGFAMSSSAVTISWSASGTNSKLFGLTSGSAMTVGASSQTASIVMYYFDYADYDDIISLGKVGATDDNLRSYVVASAAGQDSASSGAAGRVKVSTSNTDYTTAGSSFFARAYATFDDKTYFIDLFGGGGTGGTWALTSSGDESVPTKFSWSNGTYGGATADAVGTKNAWVAVPEPSVALMGLLGLGMLIKRRRA